MLNVVSERLDLDLDSFLMSGNWKSIECGG